MTDLAFDDTIWPGFYDLGYEWRRELLTELGAEPPPAAPRLRLAPARCGTCGYLTSAIGHRVMCDG